MGSSINSHPKYFHCFHLLVIAALISLCFPSTLLAQESRAERISALCDSGFVLLEREEYESAQKVFEQALRLDRDAPRVLYGMGRAFLELPRGTGRALDYLRRAAEKMPDDINVLYYKASAHTRLAETDIVGSNNGRMAIQDFEKVLAINPSHPDAYYLIGKIYRDIYADYGKAIDAFRLQVEVNPGHVESRVECLKAEIDVGAWDDAISTAEGTLDREPGLWEIMPFLAAAYRKASRANEAMQAFEKFFTTAPETERGLYFDLGYLLTPAEQRELMALGDEGLQAYWMNYWRSKDPDPKTMVNERLLEHFIRIAYARIEFGKKEWPWDARGDFYVRYGEPDIRMGPNRPYALGIVDDWDFYLKMKDLREELGISSEVSWYVPGWLEIRYQAFGYRETVDGSGTPEGWLYLDRGISIQFDNPVMSGRYLVAPSYPELVEAMGRRMPVLSEEEEKIETFDPLQSAVTFRGEDGRTVLEYAIGLLPDHIGQFRSLTGEYAYIDARLELLTTGWRPVADAVDTVRHVELRPQVSIRGYPMFVHGTRLEVDPGEYIFSTLIMDAETGMRSTSKEEIVLPDYTGNELMISDILPAAEINEVGPGRIGRFIRGELEVIPLPGRNLGRDQPLFIYFEVYNLTRNQYGASRYRVEYSVSEAPESGAPIVRIYQGLRNLVGLDRRRAVLSSEFTQSDIRRDLSTYLELDMSEPPHGVYQLVVTITDLNSRQTASSGLTFRTLPMPPAE